jgi:signal transduction histidine kinase
MTNYKVNILVVDDLPEKLLVIESVLAELGENLVFARSGTEALQQVLQGEFAVILLDVLMPDMDGFETATLIRKRKKSAHVPIIFITAYADEMHTAQGYSLGAVDYILSPVVPEILRSKVKVFVDLFRMTQQVKRQADERIALMQEQAARAAAEESNRRLAFLARTGNVLGRSLDYEATARDAARLAVPFLADLSAITLIGPHDSEWRTVLVQVGSEGAVLQEQFAGRDGLPDALVHMLERVFDVETRELLVAGEPDPFANALVLPLQARGRTIGALALAHCSDDRHFGPGETAIAESLASRAAIALDNALLYSDVQRADRQKNEFLSMLAHELRNPLAPIRNAVQILRTEDQRELPWAREVIERQVTQLVRLVDDLLDVSRITQGKIRLHNETVVIQGIVNQAIETSHPLIAARKHQLTVTVPPRPVWVCGDAVRLAQVLTNLLNNAAKYTDEGGRIWVEVALVEEGPDARSEPRSADVSMTGIASGDSNSTNCLPPTAHDKTRFVEIRVRDTGVGIPPPMLSSIFELFTQVDRSLDRSQGGLGIGLTLVRHLVQMHGGTVRAASSGPCRGSEFVVYLPTIPAPAMVPPPLAPGRAVAAAPNPRGRVLIVDDNRDAAVSLALLLRVEGYEVQTAHDGSAALTVAQTFRPNVVLLDIGLPEMDGYEVARRLRQEPDTANALLVAVTGYSQDEDRRRSQESGIDHYMVKPVDLNALPALLAGHQNNQPATRTAAMVCTDQNT